MALRHHKKLIIHNHGGGGDDGDLTIHYMNHDDFESAFQQSALLSQPSNNSESTSTETTIKEQKELIATLQKSLEDTTKDLQLSQASSQEANDHRTLLVAQHTQLEKEKNELKRDITALVDSHKSEVIELQQEAKANADTVQKKATDELEESRASYNQMKTDLEQQIYDLEQQNKNLRESSWCDIKLKNEEVQALQDEARVASESIKSLQKSNKTLEQSNNTLEQSNKKLQQSHTTLGQYIQGQNVEIQAKTNAIAESKISQVQLSREHKKLQATLKTATDMINTRTSRITQLEKQYIERGEALITATDKIRTLEQQYEEQQESSAAKYNELQKEYKLLENDNKVKSDEVQSLKTEVRDFKTRIDAKMKVLQEKKQSVSQQYDTQLTTLNHSVASLQKEKQTKELEIEKLTSSNQNLLALYSKQGRDNAALGSKVISLKLNIKEMKANEEDTIRSYKKEAATEKAAAERMKAQVNELTEDNQSQVKINTSLQSQLDVATDCKNAMQERITFLEKKLLKATSSSSKSSNTTTDDIVEVQSSEGDEQGLDVKTKASKVDTATASSASTPAQPNTTPRSSLSNALSDIGNHQSANSTKGTITKQKKTTDLKSQASTANSSSQKVVVAVDNSTATSPATSESELCCDHGTNSEPKQDQNQTTGSILDKQVHCSSSCKSDNFNQGYEGESEVIHPRRQKRQSLEEYVQSLGTNNHQCKTKEGGTKSDDNEKDKINSNIDKDELVKEQKGKAETTSGKSIEAEINKTNTTKTTEDISELNVQEKRKRKSVELYIPKRIRPKRKKSVESTVDNSTEDKENVDDGNIKVGEIGYKVNDSSCVSIVSSSSSVSSSSYHRSSFQSIRLAV